MKRTFTFLTSLLLMIGTMWAQEDVTERYIFQHHFETGGGWTTNTSKEYYEMRLGKIGEFSIYETAGPAATVDDTHLSTEYCLGLEFRWGGFTQFSQESMQELPEGVYTLSFDVENTNPNTVADNYESLFYVEANNNKFVDSAVEWKSGGASPWTTHTITFVVKSTSHVNFSLGIGAGTTNRPGEETPTLYVSHLKLTYDVQGRVLKPGENVTDWFLTNANFERASAQNGNAINTPPGWTMKNELSGWLDGSTRLSENPGNDGTQCFNVWADKVTSVDMFQKVNLPAGKWRLSTGFYSDIAGERYVYATVDGKVYKSLSADVLGTWTTVDVTFNNLNEGEVTLGAMCRDAWFQIDNVRLEYLGEVTKDDYVNTYNSVLAEAQAIAGEKMSSAAKSLLETAIVGNESLTADNSIEELEAATAAISEAIATVTVSVNSYKVLAAGTLPDNSLDGWTCTNGNTFQVNTWSVEGASDGTNMVTPFIENWVAKENSPLGNGKISYTLANVNPGYYKVSSLIRVYSERGNDVSGASFFANDVKTDLTTGNPFTSGSSKGIYDTYTAVVNIGEEGVLEFGVEINEPTFNWVAFKNVKIEYIGVIDQAAAEALKAKIPTTKYDATLAAEIEDLVAAVDAGVTFENYLALAEKVALAENSAAAYANNKTAIDAMFALMESTNVYTAEAYEAYHAKAEDFLAQYEAGTLTATVDNPAAIHGWHATADYGEMLVSAFGTTNDDWANLHINTWSVEGETDGSEFKVPFYEYWTNDDKSLDAKTFTATVTDLRPGQYYSVRAWVRVRAKNGVAADEADGITLSVGNGTPISVTDNNTVLGDSQFSLAEYSAEGAADAEGNLTISFEVLDGTNISWLSFKNLKYTETFAPIVTQHLNVVGAKVGDVAIVEGAATVTSIATIDVTFDRPVALAEDAGWATVTDEWGENSLKAEVLADNNCVVRFSLQWGLVIAEDGDFPFYVPEGLVVSAEDANYINAEIAAIITVEAAPATPLTVTNVTVGEDVMADLSAIVATPADMIKVNFDGEFYFQGTPAIVDAEDNDASEYFEYMNGLDVDGSNSYIFKGKTAGTYTITLAKASFMEMAQWKAPAEDIVLTVQIISDKEPEFVEVTAIKLNKTQVEFSKAGDTFQLEATVTPEDATNKDITWKSNNDDVATVSEDGVITAVGNGTAEITVTAANGVVKATCYVIVDTISDGIDSIKADSETVIYDIHGRRVTEMTKGIYIVNGKKVIKK